MDECKPLASGWLQSVSAGGGNDAEAGILIDFLSPKGLLMKAVLAADADGLMQFAFPVVGRCRLTL